MGADGRADAALEVREGPTTAAAAPVVAAAAAAAAAAVSAEDFETCCDFDAALDRRGELRVAGGRESIRAAQLDDDWLISAADDDGEVSLAFGVKVADDNGSAVVMGSWPLPFTGRF